MTLADPPFSWDCPFKKLIFHLALLSYHQLLSIYLRKNVIHTVSLILRKIRFLSAEAMQKPTQTKQIYFTVYFKHVYLFTASFCLVVVILLTSSSIYPSQFFYVSCRKDCFSRLSPYSTLFFVHCIGNLTYYRP